MTLQLSKPQLSVVREISVQGECHGIAYLDNTLIVTKGYGVGAVDILDMSGQVLRTISAGQMDKTIFYNPDYVTVDPATGSMYVSDWEWSSVGGRLVKLSKEGNVEAIYISDEGGCPHQVALDTQGMLYVAYENGCVEQLSTNCVKVRTLISDLTCPTALSYDEATQQLYVGEEKMTL